MQNGKGTVADVSVVTQDLIDAQQGPFILIDQDFTIVAANQQYAEAYGLQKAVEVVGRKCHSVSHRSDRPCYLQGEDCPHRRVFAGEGQVEVVHRHYGKDGEPEIATIRGTPIRNAAGKLEWMAEAISRNVQSETLFDPDSEMIGHSRAFVSAVKVLSQVARSALPVLVTGETGTGKELAARFVHRHSAQSKGRFVPVDCNVLGEELLASELFGHEKGAFTGAVAAKQGLYELAANGTLFLDEIGDISPNLQAKLLRVLESGSFRRVGGTELRSATVRLVFATNRDLKQMVAAGTFRKDLYYRLARVHVELAPLRTRRADIPELCLHVLRRQPRYRNLVEPITPEAQAMLEAYDYPGNIRELVNILERAAMLAEGGKIQPKHLTDEVRNGPVRAVVDQQAVREALERHHGNRREAARELGVTERTLYRWLRAS